MPEHNNIRQSLIVQGALGQSVDLHQVRADTKRPRALELKRERTAHGNRIRALLVLRNLVMAKGNMRELAFGVTSTNSADGFVKNPVLSRNRIVNSQAASR